MVSMEEVKARLESAASFLEGLVNDYDFETEEEEKRLTEARGEEYTPWCCDSCGADFDLYDEARWQFDQISKILERLG